jgi:nicotinate-nucleotide adenylyltransferase
MAAAGYGEVWLTVSPRNPLKEQAELAHDEQRLEMARIAAADEPRISVCDIEFSLPRPSYTIDTLRALECEHPDRRFSLLVGSDVFGQFDRWKEFRALMDSYAIWVYPRAGWSVGEYAGRVKMVPRAPLFEFSSTAIRERLLRGGDCGGMLDGGVYKYIREHGLWASTATDAAREPAPRDWRGWLERGKLRFSKGELGEALNDLARAEELMPDDPQAAQYAEMIREILEFRHTDIYNP